MGFFGGVRGDFGEKSSLHLHHLVDSAQALRQPQTQSVQQHFLGFIGCCHATKSDHLAALIIPAACRQDHIAALDLGKIRQPDKYPHNTTKIRQSL